MKKIALIFSILMVILVAGCGTATPTRAPTPTPAPKPTQPPAVATSTTAPVSAVQSSASTVSPTVVVPSSTLTVIAPTTPAPTTPAATLAPGLYVSNLRIDPNPPIRGAELIFYPTFINATGAVQNYKWIVYVYRADALNKSFSETSPMLSTIPIGTNEFKGAGSWKISLGGPCEDFIARVAFLDQNNQPFNFKQPDGKAYEKAFTVCAPVDLPPGSPAPTQTPTPTPTFAPGLFVMDLRTEPNPPTRGADLAFYVTFANTTGSLQNLKWNIYIYKPGDRNAYGETTATTTILGNGINDYSTIGFWHAPINGPCEEFVARVGWFDNENKLKLFTVFENQPFEKTFTVCPP